MSDSGNSTTDNAPINDAPDHFPSLVSLRAAHGELIRRRRDSGDTPEFLGEVAAFIQRGNATGALLDANEDRRAAQSLLDYWAKNLYRADREPPDATLAEFDPTLAPELDDTDCPYLGLDAFHETDHKVFFGRQRLVEEMIGRLKERRLLAVVGPSGSGKSSVVLAGLLPALKAGTVPGSQEWHYYSPMVPGSDPLANLAHLFQPADIDATRWTQLQVAGFQSDSGRLAQLLGGLKAPALLIVDQFEELFTLCSDDEVRQAFADNLRELIQMPEAGHAIVLTMRTDFEPHVARLPQFQPLFEAAQVRVRPLSASELREAIEKPAELVGLKFEEGVVDALLQDLLGELAALPLLQFTLLKLWENRERNRITWQAYRRLGGGRQALAHSADDFYEGLIPEEQVTARRILLRMVRPAEGLEVTSNRIRREELYLAGEARDRIDRVLVRLIRARLVRLTESDRPSDDQVEVAHEALVRNWPRLVDWLEEERENIRQRLRLTAAAGEWATLGREPEALWRGALLDVALRYKDLNELETEFVQASQAAIAEANRKEEEARQRELEQAQRLAEEQRLRAEEQAKATRRLRLALVALAALLILAVGASVLVIRQTQVNARLAMAATAEAVNAAAAVTQAAAKETLVAALDTQATAVAQLVTAEAGGQEVSGAQETVQASEATAAAARETDQAREATVVAARKTADAAAIISPTPTQAPASTPTLTGTHTPTSIPTPTPTVMHTPTSTPTPTPTVRQPVLINSEIPVAVEQQHEIIPKLAYNPERKQYLVVLEADEGRRIVGKMVSGNGRPINNLVFSETPSLGCRLSPTVAYNARRREFLVVWVERGTDPGIYGRRLSDSGVLLTDSFRISPKMTWVTFCSVAISYNSDDDQYLVMWSDNREVTLHIYGRFIGVEDPDADKEEDFLLSKGSQPQWRPEITYGNGRYLVVWEDWRHYRDQNLGSQISCLRRLPDDLDIAAVYGQFLAPNGNSLGGTFNVSPLSPSLTPSYHARVAYNSKLDEYLVVWNAGKWEQYGDIWGRRVAYAESEGARLSDLIPIACAPQSEHAPVTGYDIWTDAYLVAWEAGTGLRGPRPQGSGNYDIKACWIGATSDSPGKSVVISPYSESQHSPRVAVESDTGRALIVWDDYRNGKWADIYGQLVK